MLYRAINGESGSVSVSSGSGPERREDPGVAGPHQPPRYEVCNKVILLNISF